ncbi:UNVERIFIED_CONTAM: hypothetical protein RKD50_008893 [Streptomyces canus]
MPSTVTASVRSLYGRVRPGVLPSSAVRLCLHVADLAAAHEELRGRGVDIVRPPVKEP